MRHFQVSENSFGLAVWSIDEVIGEHRWRVAEVDSWRVELPRVNSPACGVGVSANGLGFIRIVAAQIIVSQRQARFS